MLSAIEPDNISLSVFLFTLIIKNHQKKAKNLEKSFYRYAGPLAITCP